VEVEVVASAVVEVVAGAVLDVGGGLVVDVVGVTGPLVGVTGPVVVVDPPMPAPAHEPTIRTSADAASRDFISGEPIGMSVSEGAST
jgi:hypothetical protein